MYPKQCLHGHADITPAELFGQNTPLDKAAAQWNTRFDAHQSLALAEIVNLVLRSAGCDVEVTEYDIEDPDEAPNKLTEIQTIFQKVIQLPHDAYRGLKANLIEAIASRISDHFEEQRQRQF